MYSGPMGSVLTPAIFDADQAHLLPTASTFCGKCESVCPMKIPLTGMMRHWRERAFERHLAPATTRYGIRGWGFVARRPGLYRSVSRLAAWGLGVMGRKRGRFGWLPLAGAWTAARDMPAPEGETFFARYAREQRSR
jgi:L-lactate dehydrogenase complex protein LldF